MESLYNDLYSISRTGMDDDLEVLSSVSLFWLGYNAIQCEDDFYVFLEKTCWICCGYALIIGGVSAKFISPLYVFLNFTSGGLFVSYASLADFSRF